MAPGQGQKPFDVILDADSKELAFPSIYGVVKRQSELRNVGRRGCRIDKLFINCKKLELIKI